MGKGERRGTIKERWKKGISGKEKKQKQSMMDKSAGMRYIRRIWETDSDEKKARSEGMRRIKTGGTGQKDNNGVIVEGCKDSSSC